MKASFSRKKKHKQQNDDTIVNKSRSNSLELNQLKTLFTESEQILKQMNADNIALEKQIYIFAKIKDPAEFNKNKQEICNKIKEQIKQVSKNIYQLENLNLKQQQFINLRKIKLPVLRKILEDEIEKFGRILKKIQYLSIDFYKEEQNAFKSQLQESITPVQGRNTQSKRFMGSQLEDPYASFHYEYQNSNEDNNILSQQQLDKLKSFEGQIAATDFIILERQKEMDQIEVLIVSLKNLMYDAADLVVEQGKQVEQLVQNIESVNQQVHEGVDNLRAANNEAVPEKQLLKNKKDNKIQSDKIQSKINLSDRKTVGKTSSSNCLEGKSKNMFMKMFSICCYQSNSTST